MTVPLQITKWDGSALGSIPPLLAERAVPSAHVQMAVKNIGVVPADVVGIFYAEGLVGGVLDFITRGHPAVDERQGRMQVMDYDSSGTPGQTVAITAPQPMGHLANPVLPSLLPGNTLFLEAWLEQASTSAGGGAVRIKIEFAGQASAFPLEDGVTEVGRGIISGTNSPRSFLVNGRLLTVTGTPDDQVHVAAGSWVFEGVAGTDASVEDITLDLNDGAAATLVTDEAYIAAASQGASAVPTVTKGLKASTTSGPGPVAPSVPFGEVLLGFVQVNYHATAPVIVSGNLSQTDLTYGRYLVVPAASGLTATVHSGEALLAGFRTARPVKNDVVLTASAINRIWVEATGEVTVTTTAGQPSPGALKLGEATTNATDVTAYADMRTYVGQAGVLSLHAATHASGASDPVSPASIGAASLTDIAGLAPIDSPVFTTDQQGVTPSQGDSSKSLATTEFVQGEIAVLFTDHFLEFVGNGSSQPSTLSPVPAPGSIVLVDVNGQIVRAGAGRKYTDDGVGNIVFTPVLDSTETAGLHWRGL